MDRDGFISNGELFLVLKMMVGNNLRDQQLQQIVDKTIMEADLDEDGKISFEEFMKVVEDSNIAQTMSISDVGVVDCRSESFFGAYTTPCPVFRSNHCACHCRGQDGVILCAITWCAERGFDSGARGAAGESDVAKSVSTMNELKKTDVFLLLRHF